MPESQKSYAIIEVRVFKILNKFVAVEMEHDLLLAVKNSRRDSRLKYLHRKRVLLRRGHCIEPVSVRAANNRSRSDAQDFLFIPSPPPFFF